MFAECASKVGQKGSSEKKLALESITIRFTNRDFFFNYAHQAINRWNSYSQVYISSSTSSITFVLHFTSAPNYLATGGPCYRRRSDRPFSAGREVLVYTFFL